MSTYKKREKRKGGHALFRSLKQPSWQKRGVQD